MRSILMATSLITLSPPLQSPTTPTLHGGHGHGAAFEGGAPGKATEATRQVTVIAIDSDFAPKSVTVKSGETVRFVVRNDGKLVHEFTIGTKAMQVVHQSEMLGLAVIGAIEADKVDRSKLGARAIAQALTPSSPRSAVSRRRCS